MPPRPTRPTLLWLGLALLGALAVALVVLALALPSWARSKTREALDGLDGARGEFQDVQVTLFPLRYTITRLKITKDDSVLGQPFLYAEHVAVTFRPASLLRGVFAGVVQADRVKAVIEQPKPGGGGKLPSISSLLPVKAVLERVQIRDSEVLYAWVREKGRPSLWVHGIEATLENLGSRPGLTTGPMVLAARGTIARKGTATVEVSAEPFAERVTFSAVSALAGFDPAQMNAYLTAIQNVSVTSGVYDTRMRFRCHDGRLEGTIDPRLRGSELTSSGDVGSSLKALFGKVSMTFSGPTEGTRPNGAIAVRDDLTDPELQLAAVVEKVIEKGFILGLQEGLTRRYHGPPGDSASPEPTPLKAHD